MDVVVEKNYRDKETNKDIETRTEKSESEIKN
jgi:hypothetical protein